jgi:hypothetical protein
LVLVLAACDAGTNGGRVSTVVDASPLSASSSADSGTLVLCTTSPEEGTVCNGGENGPGLTAQSVNNEGLIGDSIKGRGVYGSSVAIEGGYFSSTNGDALLGYSQNGYAGHFTGGRGVIVDAPGIGGSPALTANGPALVALLSADAGVVPVCGSLDTASGLFQLTKCDDRLDKLEAEVAVLMARLGPADAGAD